MFLILYIEKNKIIIIISNQVCIEQNFYCGKSFVEL